MNAQTEHKAKACFQALLRCSRFSRRSLKLSLSINFRRCKSRQKKEVHETTPCTSVGNYVGSVGFYVDFFVCLEKNCYFCTH
jgi:hypothetical protein